MIRFKNVGKAFRSRRNKNQLIWPIRNFTTTINKGESTAILVPEGGGKTTFIDMVAGTEPPTEGQILRGGHISWPVNFRGTIHGRMSVRQNLRFLTDTYGQDFRSAYEFVNEFGEFGRYMDLPLRQFSNEQRQRLSLSLIFAMNFEFILVDENFEGGDANFKRKVSEYVDARNHHITFLMATGNTRIAERYCKRAGILVDGAVTFYDTMAEALSEFRRYSDE